METRKLSEDDVRAALAVTNDRWKGNVVLNELRAIDGTGLRFTLRIASYDGPGWRYSPSGIGDKDRRTRSACWHVHRDFMAALFDRNPNATLRTAFYTAKGRADWEDKFPASKDRNAGSMYAPRTFGSLCGQPHVDDNAITFGTLHSNGELTGVRTLNQSDIRACPFFIMVAEHYRADGSCKCDDPEHRAMMIREWEYTEEDFARAGLTTVS